MTQASAMQAFRELDQKASDDAALRLLEREEQGEDLELGAGPAGFFKKQLDRMSDLATQRQLREYELPAVISGTGDEPELRVGDDVVTERLHPSKARKAPEPRPKPDPTPAPDPSPAPAPPPVETSEDVARATTEHAMRDARTSRPPPGSATTLPSTRTSSTSSRSSGGNGNGEDGAVPWGLWAAGAGIVGLILWRNSQQ